MWRCYQLMLCSQTASRPASCLAPGGQDQAPSMAHWHLAPGTIGVALCLPAGIDLAWPLPLRAAAPCSSDTSAAVGGFSFALPVTPASEEPDQMVFKSWPSIQSSPSRQSMEPQTMSDDEAIAQPKACGGATLPAAPAGWLAGWLTAGYRDLVLAPAAVSAAGTVRQLHPPRPCITPACHSFTLLRRDSGPVCAHAQPAL
jgi:hypothetical protein